MSAAKTDPADWNLALLATRRSASAEASFKAELTRTRAMTVKERMIEALELSQQLSRLRAAPIQQREPR